MNNSNTIFKISALSAAVSLAVMYSFQAQAADIEFDEVVAPFDAVNITTSNNLTVDGGVIQPLSFKTLFSTGQEDNGETYGMMKDYKGNPAKSGTGDNYICSGNAAGVKGSGTDFSAILQKGGKNYLITQFECQTGGMYLAELGADMSPVPNTLEWIDNTSEWGGWVHCAGSVTPWNTYLGGEEYEPNAKKLEGQSYPTTDDYYNDKVRSYWLGDISKSSPYQNGWITEIDIVAGKPTYEKHYAMGRFSHELGYVMPDKRTVYLTDDGVNDTLFMFVAKKAGDLTEGKLYAAKWEQTSSYGGGSAQLKWISLGKARSRHIKRAIDRDIEFSDMFDEDVAGCKTISANGETECLKVKKNKEILASRLESRRYAALMGATHEFRKMEGFTFDEQRNRAFIAISEVGRGMLDNTGDPDKGGTNYDDLDGDTIAETGNHIRVNKPDYCGAVYSMDINTESSTVSDHKGSMIHSDYVVTNMNSILASGTADGEVTPEECALNNDIMAQPDNIAMAPGTNALIIGEDGKHENNMVWSFNLDTHELTRIATVPLGAETTSPYFHKVGNDYYMTLVAQHPDPSGVNSDGDSITGVVGPMNLD